MNGKVALITGGARGLGRAFTEKLLSTGAKVCIIDILESLGRKTEQELQKKYNSNNVCFYACDVTSTDNFEGAFKHTIKEYGRLDLVCNNAGVENEDQWKRMIDINLTAVIQGTMLGIQYMSPPSGQGGVIINVASAAGVVPLGVVPIYTASKQGVVGFTRGIGGQAKRNHNVRINCMCPTFTHTAMVQGDLQEHFAVTSTGMMTADEVANAFMDLVHASDKVSGAVMLATPKAKRILQLPKSIEQAFETFSKL